MRLRLHSATLLNHQLHLGIVVLYIQLVLGCNAIAGSGTPFLEIRYARVDGQRLVLVFDSYEVSGTQRLSNVRQFLSTFQLDGDLPPKHLDTSELADGKTRGSEFLISTDANRVLLIQSPELTVIGDKVYPVAALRLVVRDKAKNAWVEISSWNSAPFYADRDVTRLIRRERGQTFAYDLQTGRRLNIDHLEELFASIGSASSEPNIPIVNGIDSPPDYSALTSNLAYGSVDGGIVSARFIYERGLRRKLPSGLDVAGFGRVYLNEVRENGKWEFFCLKFGPQKPSTERGVNPPEDIGAIVITEDLEEVRGAMEPSAEFRRFVDRPGRYWSPKDRVMISYDVNHNAARHGPAFRVELWRYGDASPSRIVPINIDTRNIFRFTSEGLELMSENSPK